MNLHIFFALLILMTCAAPRAAVAQKLYRIGALVAEDQFLPAFEGFKKKMAEMGYKEGYNIKYDLHNAQGNKETLDKLAQKLAQDRPDLIVTSSTTATAPMARATAGTTLPVVFLSAGNPLRFVKSYASSGNNLTGVSTSSIDLTDKRMELLKELDPRIKRVINLHNPNGEVYEANLRATRAAGKKLGLELVDVDVNVTSTEDLIEKGKKILTRKLGDGIFYPPDAIIVNAAIREFTLHTNKERLASVAANISSVKNGVLGTYAPDYFNLGEQGAVLVDKVLRGASPSDLPIELPFKLMLAINLKTARAIGLKISRELLLRADEVIE